jgi:hypothetical protein
MTDPVTITTLIVSASSIIVIPILIKSLDIVLYCAKHIKNSSCCCWNVEMEPEKLTSKTKLKEETNLIDKE